MQDSLNNLLLQKIAWLQRVQPETAIVIEAQLKIAQKNILEFIATTTDKQKIKVFVNQEMTKSLGSFETILNSDIKEITELSYVATGAIMANYVSKDLASSFKGWKSIDSTVEAKLLNKDRLLFGNLMSKHKQKMLLNANMRLNDVINEGFKEKIGIAEISRNIRNKLGFTLNEAKTLSTTAIFQSINEAQWASMDYFEDEIEMYIYIGVSDSRQTSYCRLRTNRRSKIREEITRMLNSHWKCRSSLGIRTDLSDEIDKLSPNKNLVEWDEKTVNHRDGTKSTKFKVDEVKQISKNSTPKQVFDSFSDEYQKDYLGNYRYDLYKKGKVDFYTVHNSAQDGLMTIDKLKKKLDL